jgi:putative hydrolase of the HAD superfamily
MYSVIVFDLGNVLIPFDYQIVVKKFNRIKPGLGKKFYKLYQDNYNIHRDFEKGIINTEQFLTIMLEWLEGKVFGKKFCKIYSSLFSVNQNVVDMLPALKKKKYKLVLLSNTNPIHKKYGYRHYDFLKFFDKQILSHEVGAVKPEKKIYNAVQEFTQQPASKHFYIDDIREYVDAAKKMGWGGIQFTGYENLVDELKKKKIL